MRGHRVGIVNPRTPFGGRLRELLGEQPFPVTELKLFESEIAGEATLARFRDDVVVTQPLDADVFPQLDVCFFASGDSDVLNRMAETAAESDVLTIVHGALALDAPVMIPGVNDVSLADRIVAVPRHASHLVGVVAKRVREQMPVRHVSATVLVPAGERGDEGAEELHRQVVDVLSFKDPPSEVFRDQLAFNVLPVARGGRASSLAETVAREASELAELPGAVTVSLVRVPVFHAYAASVWVELEEPQEQRALTSCFAGPPFTLEGPRARKAVSPVGAAESPLIHVGSLRRPAETSRPGFWLSAVADTTAYDPARTAVELARAVLS